MDAMYHRLLHVLSLGFCLAGLAFGDPVTDPQTKSSVTSPTEAAQAYRAAPEPASIVLMGTVLILTSRILSRYTRKHSDSRD
jgi:hypothetical protein